MFLSKSVFKEKLVAEYSASYPIYKPRANAFPQGELQLQCKTIFELYFLLLYIIVYLKQMHPGYNLSANANAFETRSSQSHAMVIR